MRSAALFILLLPTLLFTIIPVFENNPTWPPPPAPAPGLLWCQPGSMACWVIAYHMVGTHTNTLTLIGHHLPANSIYRVLYFYNFIFDYYLQHASQYCYLLSVICYHIQHCLWVETPARVYCSMVTGPAHRDIVNTVNNTHTDTTIDTDTDIHRH